MSAQSALASGPSQSADERFHPVIAEPPAASAAAAGEAGTGVTPVNEELAKPEAGGDISSAEPAGSASAHEQAIARIWQSAALPPAFRERLAALVQSSGQAAVDGQMRVPLESCLKALEESLPDFLRESRGDAARLEHPAGEVFFRGASEGLSDERAEALAHRQLVRSGLLRGQKVRVAD
jgi:hypothetical protein